MRRAVGVFDEARQLLEDPQRAVLHRPTRIESTIVCESERVSDEGFVQHMLQSRQRALAPITIHWLLYVPLFSLLKMTALRTRQHVATNMDAQACSPVAGIGSHAVGDNDANPAHLCTRTRTIRGLLSVATVAHESFRLQLVVEREIEHVIRGFHHDQLIRPASDTNVNRSARAVSANMM